MIVIAGKNNISVRALYFIRLQRMDISVVLNKTDDGVDGWQKSLENYAVKNGIQIITLEQAYKEANIFMSLEFDRLVRPGNFKNANLYNIHFSSLPKYKGMYTSIWPIINNEKIGGVTLHEIDAGIDTGNIYDQIIFDIKEVFRSRDLYREYLENSYLMFKNNLSSVLRGSNHSRPQSGKNSSYFSKSSIDFSSFKINLNATAFEILRQIYAFSFREYQLPNVFGKKVVEAEILDDRSKFKPGALVFENEEYMIISTIDYDLRVYFDGINLINKFSNCTVEQAKKLLKNLAGVNDRNRNGWSPLILAAYHGNHDVVRYLLDNGALVNDENYNGTTALMYAKEYALKYRDKTSYDELIFRGADVDRVDLYEKKLIEYLSASDANFLGV